MSMKIAYPNNNSDQFIDIEIKYVRQVFFSVHENLISKEEEKAVFVGMSANIGNALDRDMLNFKLKSWYHYEDIEEKLAVIEVENIFVIKDLKRYKGEGKEIDFPARVWVTIVSLAISHTRALLTHNLGSTELQHVIIPLLNPEKIARDFYPKSFDTSEQRQLVSGDE